MKVISESRLVNGNVVNTIEVFDVRETTTISYQIELAEGSWATAVLTLYRSNDKKNWQAMSTPVATTPGVVGFYPSSSGYDTSQTNYHKWEVTTAEGSALILSIAASGKAYPI